MKTNSAGIDLIKSFESCSLNAYQGKKDKLGIITIGWGHVGGYYLGDSVTQEEADTILSKDLEHFENGVTNLLTGEVSDNQFAALVSFSFNLGLGNLKTSHLLIYTNEGKFDLAADEFVKWNKSNGQVVDGLTRRRLAEKELYQS